MHLVIPLHCGTQYVPDKWGKQVSMMHHIS
jgi:hypothetical protein